MSRRVKVKIYPHGSLYYGRRVPIKNAANRTVGHSFEPVDHALRFALLQAREEDVEFANRIDRRLDLKVKVPDDKRISNEHAVQIRSELYEIIKLDRFDGEVYLYLQTADRKG